MKRIVLLISGLLLTVLIIAVLKFYYFNNPDRTVLMPKCMFYTLTGWKCPGCGSQRALYYFLHGEIKMSFLQNPLLYFAVLYLIVVGIWGKKFHFLWGVKACVFWIAAVFSFWILRNVL